MKPFFKLLIIVSYITQISNYCSAQNPDIKRTMHWYFGYGAGLDFSSGTPIADTTGISDGGEACFTISDTCGSLLFYGAPVDSIGMLIIRDRNHQIMQNGLLNSCCTPTQSVCISQPGNDSLFYIFYNHLGGSDLGKLNYAIVNINRNNGLGEVITWDNTLLDSLSTEKVAATIHCNGTDYWICGKMTGNWTPIGNQLFVWQLTSGGLNPIPVVSAPGNIGWENGDGYFRFSPNGSLAACTFIYPTSLYYKDSSYFEIYQFDNCTGIFSNPITIQFPQAAGLCFSPDNSKLYVGIADGFGTTVDTGIMAQYDLSIYDQATIISSATILKQGPIWSNFQLGMDGKIYVADMDTAWPAMGFYKLGVIHNPNAKGLACNYIPEQVDLGGKMHIFGLPYYADSYFSNFNYYNCYTSLDEKTSINIKLYPNPFTDMITIESADNRQYSFLLYNLMGEIAYQSTFYNIETLNLSLLPSGIYFSNINYKNQLISTNLKIIKL